MLFSRIFLPLLPMKKDILLLRKEFLLKEVGEQMDARNKCPLCGAPVAYGDRSCKFCGRSLEAVEGTPAYLGYTQEKTHDGQKTGKEQIPNGMSAILRARKEKKEAGSADSAPHQDAAFRFASAEDGVAVCGFIGADSTELIIPSQHGGRPVVEIGREAFANLSVCSAVLPPTVHTIADGAFKNCARLFEVKGGEGLGMIGMEAFAGCCMLSRFPALNNPGVCASYSSFAGCYRLGLRTEQNCTIT